MEQTEATCAITYFQTKTKKMKKIIARIVYYFNPKYFNDCSYDRLDKWGIEDIFEGQIIWIE